MDEPKGPIAYYNRGAALCRRAGPRQAVEAACQRFQQRRFFVAQVLWHRDEPADPDYLVRYPDILRKAAVKGRAYLVQVHAEVVLPAQAVVAAKARDQRAYCHPGACAYNAASCPDRFHDFAAKLVSQDHRGLYLSVAVSKDAGVVPAHR